MKKNSTVENIEEILEKLPEEIQEDLSFLVKDYTRKSKRLETIIKQSDSQQKQLAILNDELNDYKNHLEQKVQEEMDKRKEQDRILLQQSKLAAMGEMIDAVAHQWKQPLNILSIKLGCMALDFSEHKVDDKYVQTFEDEMHRQIQHMSNTITEFRTFFKKDKPSELFDVHGMLQTTLLLLKDELKKQRIDIKIIEHAKLRINAIENEFQHLIINLINNAKDAFVENNITERKITIHIYKNRVELLDNAGGIPESIINDIFKVDFTTKKEGSGAGLYMSQLIAQKSNGKLLVNNEKEGAKFTFKLG